jgi:hypothetical protein
MTHTEIIQQNDPKTICFILHQIEKRMSFEVRQKTANWVMIKDYLGLSTSTAAYAVADWLDVDPTGRVFRARSERKPSHVEPPKLFNH